MKEIAYQNKDIVSKVFAERCKGKSLTVYGMKLPPVKAVLPTNIPVIQANELRIDNVFLLEDDTIVILDYESEYKRKNKHKYIRYINQVAEYYTKEWKRTVKIRMIVIYTADIAPRQTSDVFDVKSLRLTTESVYLSEIDSEAVTKRLTRKIKNKEALTETEMMEFVILPLSYKGKEEKNKSIRRAIDLAKEISDEETKVFLLSGVAVFADKVVRDDYLSEIRRLVQMTRLGQMFEQEKLEAITVGKWNMLDNMINKGIITLQQAADEMQCTVEEFLSMKERM